jgi:hypothetical protein
VRRQFRLPSEDESYLDVTGLQWETVLEAGLQWLIIRDRPVPSGYCAERAHTALIVPPGYPDAEIDMAYFDPPLVRRDARPIGALSVQQLEGRAWQRWSRHRTRQNPWRPGVDGVGTHLILVDHWLARELGRVAA